MSYVNILKSGGGLISDMNFVLVGYRNEEKELTNSSICKQCKGERCCKICGCAFSPEDFHPLALNFQYLRAFINRGTTSIAHLCMSNSYGAVDVESTRIIDGRIQTGISLPKLEQGDGLLYLRTRNYGYPIVDIVGNPDDGKGKRGCCLLREDGCSLSFRKRPKEGRMAIPNLEDCQAVYSVYAAVYDWWPYQRILYELYLLFNKEVQL